MGEDTPGMRAKFLATIPIGRFSTPEDMGNAACFRECWCYKRIRYFQGKKRGVDRLYAR